MNDQVPNMNQIDNSANTPAPSASATEGFQGDAFDVKTYEAHIPENARESFSKVLEHIKGEHGKVAQEYDGFKKQYDGKHAFSNAQELAALVEKNPQIRMELERLASAKGQVQPNDLGTALKNWHLMTQEERQQYHAALDQQQKITLGLALQVMDLTQKTQGIESEKKANEFSELDRLNGEKYKENYSKLLPQIKEFFKNPGNNAREVAFRNLDYDNFGKRMYEMGKKDAANGRSSLTPQNIPGNTNSQNGGTNTQPAANNGIPGKPRSLFEIIQQNARENGLVLQN